MAVPKRKTTPMKQGLRRQHHKCDIVNSGPCSNCGAQKLPHHICPTCGYYKGEAVIRVQ